MLETILKLYTMAMATGVRSPLPHLVGPPGCGKSTVVEQAAEMLGVNLHIINVSRISPLELEGVQMPVDMENNPRLHLLTATFWTQLQDGDILLLDEFLRGFPEVYNGLLDILTSRKVGGFQLPKVFIIAASNSTVAYDKALEDRLLHLPVPDVRKSKVVQRTISNLIVDELGLMRDVVDSYEMKALIDQEIAPMFEILDQFKGKGNTSVLKGSSVRNLIGQAKLRQVQSSALHELLKFNNQLATNQGKFQYLFLLDGKNVSVPAAKLQGLRGNSKLTPIQAMNLELNLQLIELENAKKEATDDDDSEFLDPDNDLF